jgi:hypothetical protein
MMPETEVAAQAAPAGPAPSQLVLQLMTGYVIAQALYVAARLGIADYLAGGPLPTAELAALSGAHPPSLARLLRALTSVGVVAESDGAYALAPLGRCLAQDAPDGVRASVLFAGAEQYQAWGELLHSVQTGEAAFRRVFGTGCYDYLAEHPEAGRSFDASMLETGGALGSAVAAAYDFSRARTVVDLGGGHGALLAAILRANADLRGVLFDLPQVVAGAGDLLEAMGVADRCTVIGGSFFEAVPAGGEVYLLARTLLNWPDEDVRRILRRCRDALGPRGRLLVVEPLLPDGAVSAADAFNDLNLLVLGGGRMCTVDELRGLLVEAGLALTRVVPSPSRFSIVEAVPAPGNGAE